MQMYLIKFIFLRKSSDNKYMYNGKTFTDIL